MYRLKRILLTLAIFLPGVALVPFVSLPAQAIGWQQFVNVYETNPVLTIDHNRGKPGSHFEIKGEIFPPNEVATIMVNGMGLGTVPIDGDGKFEFEINTAGASVGSYFVTATAQASSATVNFVLDNTDPNSWPPQSKPIIFIIPSGIAFTEFIYLPIIVR